MSARFDTNNVISEHGTMAVTYQGMASLENHFFIDRDELWSVEYEDFEDLYAWLVEADFDAALTAARAYHGSRDAQEEAAAARELEFHQTRRENAYASIDAYEGSGTLRLLFVDGTDGSPLEGVQVSIDSAVSEASTGTSDEDGEVFFNRLTIGEDESEDYTATTTAVPAGYDVPAALPITIERGNVTAQTIEVTPTP